MLYRPTAYRPTLPTLHAAGLARDGRARAAQPSFTPISL